MIAQREGASSSIASPTPMGLRWRSVKGRSGGRAQAGVRLQPVELCPGVRPPGLGALDQVEQQVERTFINRSMNGIVELATQQVFHRR